MESFCLCLNRIHFVSVFFLFFLHTVSETLNKKRMDTIIYNSSQIANSLSEKKECSRQTTTTGSQVTEGRWQKQLEAGAWKVSVCP